MEGGLGGEGRGVRREGVEGGLGGEGRVWREGIKRDKWF